MVGTLKLTAIIIIKMDKTITMHFFSDTGYSLSDQHILSPINPKVRLLIFFQIDKIYSNCFEIENSQNLSFEFQNSLFKSLSILNKISRYILGYINGQSMTCYLFWVAAPATPQLKIPPHPQLAFLMVATRKRNRKFIKF